eukprot:366154-Chlamydomonas_euryale.AAC.6
MRAAGSERPACVWDGWVWSWWVGGKVRGQVDEGRRKVLEWEVKSRACVIESGGGVDTGLLAVFQAPSRLCISS